VELLKIAFWNREEQLSAGVEDSQQNLGETYRSQRSFQRIEKAKKEYGPMVVGLTHSRIVNGLMPIESQEPGHSTELAVNISR
jgi:hypothetical protein